MSTMLEQYPVVEVEQPAARSLQPLLPAQRPAPSRKRRSVTGGVLFSSAFHMLQAYRLRSLLTMLGMSIGISAVIMVISLIQSASMEVNLYLTHLGTNIITILPGTLSTRGINSTIGSAHTLTVADAQAIETQIPHVVDTSPILNTSAQVIYGDQNWNSPVQGVYPAFQNFSQWQLSQGNWFSDQDEQAGLPVAVLGQTVAEHLFGSSLDSLGQAIRVRNQLFQVVGVLAPKGAQGSADADNIIFVPFSTAVMRLKPASSVDQIQVEVDDINTLVQTQVDIISLLRTRHHLNGQDPAVQALEQQSSQSSSLPWQQTASVTNTSTNLNSGSPSDADDFQLLSNNQLIQTAQQDTRLLSLLLIGIASIALVAGGIGIMNMMLISITERTPEIGLRMAVGARQSDIRTQFLLEALLLSITGGILGMLLGFLGGFVLASGFALPFLLTPISLALAFGIAATIGIIFGVYPAVQASRLDPIVALQARL